MATSSFFDTYYITKDDVERFHEIMFNKGTVVRIGDVSDCQELEGEDIVEFLGLKK